MFMKLSNAPFNNNLFSMGTISLMHESMSRLYEAAKIMKKTEGQSAVARLLVESPQTLNNWESRGVSRAGAIKAQEVIGCDASWVLTGKGGMTSNVRLLAKHSSPDDLTIPQYAASGSMGLGLVLEEKQPGLIKSWRVDEEWLRLNVRHHTGVKNLCIVTGFGPSMQPKYNPGDPLLLDRGVNTVETEGIFFFRVGQHGFIKQLQRIPTEDGMVIRAKSLNKDYDPFDISAKMDFEVFGKVLTVWKSEQV
jgi:phage repressor protein C with HTH and peptisase S24 domain